MELWGERFSWWSSPKKAPNGRSSITVFRPRTDGIAGLEGEVGLDGVYRREVVIFDFAKLEEAVVE